MDEREKLIKELQDADEKEALIAELKASDNAAQPQQVSVTASTPAQETSKMSQRATAVLQAGQMINPWQDELIAGIQAGGQRSAEMLGLKEDSGKLYNQLYDENIVRNKETMEGLEAANPKSALLGKVAGVTGAIAQLPSKLLPSMAVGAVQGAGSGETPEERKMMGAIGGVLPLGVAAAGKTLSAVGKSNLFQTTAKKVKGLTAKGIAGLEAGLEKLGYSATEIDEAAEGLIRADINDGNPLVQLKLLYDEGVLKGAKNTKEAASAVRHILRTNTERVEALIARDPDKVIPSTALSMDMLPMNERVANMQGVGTLADRAKSVLGRHIPQALDKSGNIKPLTRKQTQDAKIILDSLVNYDASNPLAKVDQDIIETAAHHFREALEKEVPEIGRLNQISHAAFNVQKKLNPLRNAKSEINQSAVGQAASKFVKSPFFASGAGAGIGYVAGNTLGIDTKYTTGLGLAAGMGYKLANTAPSFQKSMSALEPSALPNIGRNLDSLGKALTEYAPMIPQAMRPFIEQFMLAPKEEQEALAPSILNQLKSVGVPVETSQTGFESEFNGKIQDINERVSAASKLDDARGSLGILEWAKQKGALNKDGAIPSALVASNIIPLPPSPMPAPQPPQQLPPSDLKGMLAVVNRKNRDA